LEYNIVKENFTMKYTKCQLQKIVKKCMSRSDVCRMLNIHINGSGTRKVNKWIEEFDLDISHFELGYRRRRYKQIQKQCPVCKTMFETLEGNPREKTVCSHGCSNVHFRSGEDNGNWSGGIRSTYRGKCFEHWEHKCALCPWDTVVDVHHIDSNHDNDSPENLIPLCPNHHKLTIMLQYKDEINKEIKKLVKEKFAL